MAQPSSRPLPGSTKQYRGSFSSKVLCAGAVSASIATFGAGCSPPKQAIAVPAAQREDPGRTLRLLPPMELATAQDAIVRIVGDVTCTGTLIAEDLVLTAHHCVSARDEKGRMQSYDTDPANLVIELGGDHLPWGEVSVRAIVSPDCGYAAGEGDIAILVLSRKLIGIATMTPRMDRPPSANEEIAPWGFGRCGARSSDAVHRVLREGGKVKSVTRGQFVAPASICPGDSGGPAFSSEGNDVVGVVSSSVMDGDDKTIGTSFFIRLDAWKPLFSAAREIADGASSSELPPFRSCVW